MKRSVKFTAVALSFLFVGSTLTACSNSSKDQDSYKQSVSARRESLRKSREEKSSTENEQIKKANNQLAQDLMKSARKSPYFNAGMDRAYRL